MLYRMLLVINLIGLSLNWGWHFDVSQNFWVGVLNAVSVIWLAIIIAMEKK